MGELREKARRLSPEQLQRIITGLDTYRLRLMAADYDNEREIARVDMNLQVLHEERIRRLREPKS